MMKVAGSQDECWKGHHPYRLLLWAHLSRHLSASAVALFGGFAASYETLHGGS